MKAINNQPKLVEQVHEAILTEISEGRLRPGARIIQEQIAQDLGVSRQPVQQALLLLKNQGILRDAPGRGLLVAPLDFDYVRNMYDVRAVMEGLACRKAAERNAERAAKQGPAIIHAGRKAVQSRSTAKMIAADIKFHHFIYELSGNPLIAPAMETHWSYAQRVMGEVLIRDERPRDIWDQHEKMMELIAKGDGRAAEQMAREHIIGAAEFMIDRLQREAEEAGEQGS